MATHRRNLKFQTAIHDENVEERSRIRDQTERNRINFEGSEADRIAAESHWTNRAMYLAHGFLSKAVNAAQGRAGEVLDRVFDHKPEVRQSEPPHENHDFKDSDFPPEKYRGNGRPGRVPSHVIIEEVPER